MVEEKRTELQTVKSNLPAVPLDIKGFNRAAAARKILSGLKGWDMFVPDDLKLTIGVYKRFTGEHYLVFGASTHMGGTDYDVLYIPLDTQRPKILTRDYDEFFGKVEVEGNEVQMFTLVKALIEK